MATQSAAFNKKTVPHAMKIAVLNQSLTEWTPIIFTRLPERHLQNLSMQDLARVLDSYSTL